MNLWSTSFSGKKNVILQNIFAFYILYAKIFLDYFKRITGNSVLLGKRYCSCYQEQIFKQKNCKDFQNVYSPFFHRSSSDRFELDSSGSEILVLVPWPETRREGKTGALACRRNKDHYQNHCWKRGSSTALVPWFFPLISNLLLI